VISRAAPQFWELYRSLPPGVRVAARKAIGFAMPLETKK